MARESAWDHAADVAPNPSAATTETAPFASNSALQMLQQEAVQALEKGQGRYAYRILADQEGAFAGNIRLDYLLGRAANEAGEPGRASLALERVLSQSPADSLARAEFARALFNSGDLIGAKREFAAVLSASDVPARARATLEAFVRAIDVLTRPPKPNWTAAVEMTVGHDTNANSGSGVSSIFIPLYDLMCGPETSCVPGSAPIQAWYSQLGADIKGQRTVAAGVDVSGSVAIGARNYDGVKDANHFTLDVTSGVTLRKDSSRWSLMAIGQRLRLYSVGYRSIYGVSLEWRRNLSDGYHWGLMSQALAIRFNPNSDRNTNRTLVGVSVGREAVRGLSGALALFAGRETQVRDFDAEQALSALRIENDLVGVRSYLLRPFGSSAVVFGSASVEQKRYRDVEPLFGVRRDDKLFDYRLGLTWRSSENVELSPQVAVIKSSSSIPMFNLDRRQAWLVARYRF